MEVRSSQEQERYMKDAKTSTSDVLIFCLSGLRTLLINFHPQTTGLKFLS